MLKRLLPFLLIAVWVVPALAQELNGDSFLPDDAGLFATNGTSISLSDVSGQPFKKAFHISTLHAGANESVSFRYNIDQVVRKGDVFLLSFYTRSLQSKKETGESFMEISLDKTVNGKYDWPPLFERGLSFGANWVLNQIPFMAARDILKGELSLVIKCGKFPQVFELGATRLLNYKQSVKLADLPRSIVHYDGDAPDASWRKAAADRIEKYRKGDLSIKVVDNNGKPLKGATVSVNMKKSAFGWGTATNSTILLDTINPAYKIYRDTLLKYFNKIVFENEMKPKNWARTNHAQTIKAVEWLQSHDIPSRGHVMVWPSWQNSGHLVQLKNDTAALRAAIMNDIVEQTKVMKGRFTEWDVVNEPYAHDVFLNLLGKEIMLDWFKAARERAPGVQLFLNDYTMFHSRDAGSESFYNTVKFLKDKGAPIDAIGEQSHIGGTAPAIEYLIERLNHFSEFGLPIQISEFDITSDDDDFKARYMHDYMTVIFSHPSVIGMVQWGFWAGSHWIPSSALWDKDWNIKPNGQVYTELVTKTWSTNATGSTAKDGVYSIRAFNGDYDIIVKYKGKTTQQKYTLDGKGGNVSIKL